MHCFNFLHVCFSFDPYNVKNFWNSWGFTEHKSLKKQVCLSLKTSPKILAQMELFGFKEKKYALTLAKQTCRISLDVAVYLNSSV